MAGSEPDDHRSKPDSSKDYPDIDESLASLRLSLSKFFDSHKASRSNTDIEKKVGEIGDWVEKQKKSSDGKAKKELIQNMGKVATATVSGIQKMENGDALGGTLEIISSVTSFAGEMIGGPVGAAIGAIFGTICSIIGAIFGARKPKQPSIVDQVAAVVHKELVEFNSKLQDQKYDGLKRRVSDQTYQLQKMKQGEQLDDPNLWNDYVQFIGELGNRIELPLPYKYEDNLTKDPDVEDFVRALMTYCKAHSCFNALLLIAKGTFADLGNEYEEDIEEADRKISCQMIALQDKLAFLFDRSFLTFLGRLPAEGGKLTKIVAVSRNSEARRIVKVATRGYGFPELADYKTVELQAEIVSRQSVKLKLDQMRDPLDIVKDFRHNLQLINQPKDSLTNAMIWCARQATKPAVVTRKLEQLKLEPDMHNLEIINQTQYPLKVICGTAPKTVVQDHFTLVLLPRSPFYKYMPRLSAVGYILIYLDGKFLADDEPHESDVTRVIEFAFREDRVNIQDKTCSEFTKGKDTCDKMKAEMRKTIYWKTKGVHHMASVECSHQPNFFQYGWRFVFQDFDPFRDIVTAPTSS